MLAIVICLVLLMCTLTSGVRGGGSRRAAWARVWEGGVKQKETLIATYKEVMRPALEYASSIWFPLVSLTSINKLQDKQNAALRTATGCTQYTTQTYNICIMKHSHFPYTSTYRSPPYHANRKHNIHHIHYTNTQHTSTLRGLTSINKLQVMQNATLRTAT